MKGTRTDRDGEVSRGQSFALIPSKEKTLRPSTKGCNDN